MNLQRDAWTTSSAQKRTEHSSGLGSWWHDRHGFIFRAFTVQDARQMNQAEVIHNGWVHRDHPILSLLDVGQADTRDSLLLDVELKIYQSGSASGGSRPSFADRQRRRNAAQINKARSIGKEMFADENEKHGLLIDPQSSHRPSRGKKNRNGIRKSILKRVKLTLLPHYSNQML